MEVTTIVDSGLCLFWQILLGTEYLPFCDFSHCGNTNCEHHGRIWRLSP